MEYKLRNLKKVLLILDDEIDLLESLKDLMEGENLEVITTDSPETAQIHLDTGKIDLFIIDEPMPCALAFDFLEKLNMNSSKIKTKPIIFTGNSKAELDPELIIIHPNLKVFEKPHEMMTMIDFCHQELFKKDIT